MVEEFIELMNLGVIHFPLEYNGGDYVQVVDGVDKSTGQEILKTHELSLEEQTAWVDPDTIQINAEHLYEWLESHRFPDR